MTHETEIEFKNLLYIDEYDMLCDFFGVTSEDAKTLANHYFDTAALHIKELHSGLRIRETNGAFEATLKRMVDAQTSVETNVVISKTQAAAIFEGAPFPEAITTQLVEAHVPLAEIKAYGSLTTKRIEVEYKGGTIVLDHSQYVGTEDYELEYEVRDAAAGQQAFNALLERLNIPLRPTKKKIARFAEALAKQKG